MRRPRLITAIGVGLLALLHPAFGYWQSRMQVSIGAASAYIGPGNIVAFDAGGGLRAYNGAYASGLGKLALICTPSDAVCANVNSDSSGNFNLAGTGSLTCNNSGSICTVKTLFDSTGGNNCSGACDLTQATEANRPKLVVPGAANGCTTTSNYCMKFTSASSMQLAAASNTSFSTATAGASLVYNRASAVSNIFNVGGAAFLLGGNGSNDFRLLAGGGAIDGAANDNAWHRAQANANGASSDVFVDNSRTTGTTGTVTATGTPNLGNDTFGDFLDGFVSEVWVKFGTLSNANETNLDANAKTYWGL